MVSSFNDLQLAVRTPLRRTLLSIPAARTQRFRYRGIPAVHSSSVCVTAATLRPRMENGPALNDPAEEHRAIVDGLAASAVTVAEMGATVDEARQQLAS